MNENQKEALVSIISDLLFLILLICILVPVLLDFLSVNWVLKIIMIISSLLALVFLVSNWFANKKEITCGFIFSNIFMDAVYLIGLAHYFNYNLWGYKIQVWAYFFAIVILIALVMRSYSYAKDFSKDMFIRVLLTICFICIMLGCLGVSQFGWENNIYFKIGFGILYFYILLSLIETYLLDRKKLKAKTKYESTILLFKLLIVLTSIFTFPVYIHWLGLEGIGLEFFIQIYACLLGGIITLAGVSWTIKDQNKNRKQDELLKYKPLFYPKMRQNTNINKYQVGFISEDKDYKKVYDVGIIENSDNSIVILKKIVINNIDFYPLNNGVLAKSKQCRILLKIDNLSINDNVVLVVSDILNNE